MTKNIFFACLALVLLITTISCKKSCGINCQHGGSCNGNTCSCPDPYSGYNCDTMCTLGYEGYMCQTLSRTKFLGAWNCTSTNNLGNTTSYLITFTTTPNPLFMNMNNFNQVGSYPIVCTMTGKEQFSIDQTQQDSLGTLAGISGSGVMQNGTLVINISENSYVSFFAKATMQ